MVSPFRSSLACPITDDAFQFSLGFCVMHFYCHCSGFQMTESACGRPLHMLMTLVSLVLPIALSNVAMLLVSRNATRQREFSLRLALGARRSRLFQQPSSKASS